MKKTTFIAFLSGLLILSLFSTCKVLDVNKDVTFTVDLTVNQSGASFDDFEILDAVAESSVIDDYQDLLKSIEIKKVEYTVTYFNGPSTQQINTATLAVSDVDGNGTEVIGTVSNENLSQLQGVSKELTLNPAGTSRLEDLILNDPHTAKIQYYGTADTGPLDFVVQFTITGTITANPL